MQELLLVLQIDWTLGGQMLEASPKTPSQEPNNQEEIWRVKVKGKEELLALAAQGATIVQQPIATTNVISSHEMDNKVMPKASPTQLLSSILQWRHPFLEICRSFDD
jgi:hypothetical protein